MHFMRLASLCCMIAAALSYRSCKEVRFSYPRAPSGVYYIAAQGVEYPVYCLWTGAGNEGWVYFPRASISDAFKINLNDLYDDKTQARIRILYSLDQRETTIRQLPQYAAHNLEVRQQTTGAPAIVNNDLGPHLLLRVLPVSVAARGSVVQGFTSNGKEMKFVNCDANPNSHWAFFSNPTGKALSHAAPPESAYLLNAAWQSSTQPTSHRLPNDYFMFSEMHFGGCGTLSFSSNWPGAKGAALGLKFEGCIDPGTPAGAIAAVQDGFHLGGSIRYSCEAGRSLVGGSAVRTCTPGNKWSGSPIVCQ